MEKITIYHNVSCSKSCSALDILNQKTQGFEVREYLKSPPTEMELKDILKKLGMKAEELVRKTEPIFEEKFLNKKFTEGEWIQIMINYPILIERPIIVKGNRAVIGRPPANVNQIL